MNSLILKNRMSEVLKVDSINSSQADFLATHVPFRNITLKQKANDYSKNSITEDEIFNQLFGDASNRSNHQLIIVEGSSGAGKSHFIRWIDAKLNNDEYSNEIILLIRRSDNTLKGTIKQLLNIDAIKNIKNRDIYERLVKANTIISEKKFKDSIYHNFLVEIKNDDSGLLSNIDRSRLIALMSNSAFEDELLKSGGPIDRIYNKINSSSDNQDTVALFNVCDFTINFDFLEMLRDNDADRKAIKMGEKLVPNGNDNSNSVEITNYMNSLVERVIQNCAGIEEGDFEQIFKEIRQELFNQGKNLILLIEDITSFTGINKALLNTLIIEHTGLVQQDKLCRLISVVGTTSEYYRQFRDNYKDRVTSEIVINDNAIGDNLSDLIQFVAKYLNIMSLSKEDVEQWSKNPVDEEYPVHTVKEGKNWDYYSYGKLKLNLYPFTKDAIKNLYSRMKANRTPRYIIRDIIEKYINDILYNTENFPSNYYDDFEISSISGKVSSKIDDCSSSQNDKDRFKNLISTWGNGSLDSTKNKLGNINLSIFEELHLSNIVTQLYSSANISNNIILEPNTIDDNSTIPSNNEVNENKQYIPKVKQISIEEKNYNQFMEYVRNWHFNKDNLLHFQEVRDNLNAYIYSSINWQQEGISMQNKSLIKNSSVSIISFERQDRKKESLLSLSDDDETFKLLEHFGKWYYLGAKSWDFEDAPASMYIITKWLEKYKSKIVCAVKGVCRNNIPLYIQYDLVAEIYRKILNHEIIEKDLEKFNPNKLISQQIQSIDDTNGHCKEWKDILTYLYTTKNNKGNNISQYIHNELKDYFCIMQGSSSNKYILNYTLLKKIFNDIKSINFYYPVDEIEYDNIISSKNISREHLKNLYHKLDIIAKLEVEKAKNVLNRILSSLNLDEDDIIDKDDILSRLKYIEDFYICTNDKGLAIATRNNDLKYIRSKIKEIGFNIEILQEDFSNYNTLKILLKFSSNPIKKVLPLLDLFENFEKDINMANELMTSIQETISKNGNWQNNEDSRFTIYEEKFNQLYNDVLGGFTYD